MIVTPVSVSATPVRRIAVVFVMCRASADCGANRYRTLVVAPAIRLRHRGDVTDDGKMSAPDTTTQRWAVTRIVARFALAGLAALVVVGLATAAAARRVGEREAI